MFVSRSNNWIQVRWVVEELKRAARGNKMGYPCGGFFALDLPIFALQFHSKSADLRLEKDGFTYCSLFRARAVRWSAASEFGIVDVGLHRMVAWNFTQDFLEARNGSAFSKSITGYAAALPDTYGLEAHELVMLMEGLRKTYGKT